MFFGRSVVRRGDDRLVYSGSVHQEGVVKTSEIEGEQLNVESVRSSIARRLGVDIGC